VPGMVSIQLQLKIIEILLRDIARIFIEGLRVLKIDTLFALIGGSVGGGIEFWLWSLN
jgi:homoserine acetyltransferase